MLGTIMYDAAQVNIPAILVANGLGVCLMAAILLGRHKRSSTVSCEGRFFFWMCRICLVLCILETAGFFLDGKLFAGAHLLFLLCNIALLLLALLISCIWVCYVDYRLFADHLRLRKFYLLTLIPAAVICLLSAANFFTDVFFRIDASNVYHRGPLFFLPWVVIYCYITYGAVTSYRYRKQIDRYLFMPVLAFLGPIYVGSLIQLLCYGISLIWVSVALSLTFLYINLQNEESFLDPLTGLYNRNYLLRHMEHMVRQVEKGHHITGILLDIDSFKQINDTYGHLKGDAALQTVGKILLRSADSNHAVIRYGGDEFIILLEDAAPEDVQRIQSRIAGELQAYNAAGSTICPLSLSAGIASFDELNMFEFFQEMDRKMYEEKKSSGLRAEMSASDNDAG